MNKQFASIYFLPTKGFFVIAITITNKGLPMETCLVHLVPESGSGDELWAAAQAAMERYGHQIPHEESLRACDSWRAEHGYKSWRQFAKNAIHCSISKTDQGYTFRKGEWDGHGFGPGEGGKLEFPLNTPTERLGTALLSHLRGP